MLRIAKSSMHSADKQQMLAKWRAQAQADAQSALEDRMTRSALSAAAINEPDNQSAIMGLMARRSVPRDRFVAAQRILSDRNLDENMRRIELEKLLKTDAGQSNPDGDTDA